MSQATSLAHSTIARNVSAAATVLLKNTGVLPLKAGTKASARSVCTCATCRLALSTPRGVFPPNPVPLGSRYWPTRPCVSTGSGTQRRRYLPSSVTASFLPRAPRHQIALIGPDATNPTVHGGGSGSVAPTYTISPYTAIATRNTGKIPKSGDPNSNGGPVNCTVLDHDTDYFVKPSAMIGHGSSPTDCCTKCGQTQETATYFTLSSDGSCWCHQGQGQKQSKKGYVSGSCRNGGPAPPPSSTVSTYTGTDPAAAASAASAAEVAVVFISTVSSEGSDRKSLSFSDADNAMVAAVAKAQKNTVVVMVNPGTSNHQSPSYQS